MFRKFIIDGLAILAAALLLAACVREEISESGAGIDAEPCITLQIVTGPQTRADGTSLAPDKAVLNSVDLFFYTSGAADGAAAVFKWHGTNAEDDGKLKVSIPFNLVDDGAGNNALFGTVGKCEVFAVVNSREASALVAGETMPSKSDLRALKVTTAFFADKKGFQADPGLVMFTEEDPKNLAAGDTTPNIVNYNADSKQATGHIYVNTLAAKIDLFVKFSDTVTGADPDDGASYEWSVVKSGGLPTAETHLINGVKSAYLGGSAYGDLAADDYFDTRIMEDMDGVSVLRELTMSEEDDKEKYPYVIEAPFYTYPNRWEISPLELRRTTLLLKVGWKHSGSVDALETYYTVPLNLDGNEIESDKYYRVKVNINTLGGTNFGKPVELTPSIEIQNWSHAALAADIREIRYLEVMQKVYDEYDNEWTAIMNNSDVTTIQFFTSHKVEITKASVQYYAYNPIDPADMYQGFTRTNTPAGGVVAANFSLESNELQSGYAGAYIDELNSTITIYHDFHPLQASGNRYTHTNANTYSPYEIKLTLHHADLPVTDTSTDAEITVIQYPAIYPIASYNKQYNKDDTYISNAFQGGDLIPSTYDRGRVRVNGAYNTLGDVKGINRGWTSGFTGWLGAADNPNMYVITVGQLNEGDTPYPLHIGDPRMLFIYNELSDTEEYRTDAKYNIVINYDVYSYKDLIYSADIPAEASWSTNAPTWENNQQGDSRKLKYYYPTNESPDDFHKYMISPKFRIASALGTQEDYIDRNVARKRCASYQEDGYPAGRWRLPTPGEIAYVARLQADGIIPEVFASGLLGSDTQSYWTSHGLYELSGKTITDVETDAFRARNTRGRTVGTYTAVGYTRCVYDEWYWVTIPDGKADVPTPNNVTSGNYYDFRWGDKPKNDPQQQPEQN